MPFVEVKGINCAYEVHGEGPALVLIHGLGSSARDWAPQIQAFAPDHSVIAVDLYGHGRSTEMPPHCRMHDFAGQVAAVLKKEAVAQAHLVGISLGGAVALQLALEFPALLKSLVVVNSRPDFTPQSWGDRLMVLQRLLVIRLMGMRQMGKLLSAKLFPESFDLQQQFIERYSLNSKTKYLHSLKALLCWDVSDRLGEKYSVPRWSFHPSMITTRLKRHALLLIG